MEKVINIFRYVFTIPVAILGAILGSMFIPYIFTMYFLPGSLIYSIVFAVSSSISLVLIFFNILYYMPPKKHTKIITVLGALYILMWIISLILSIILEIFEVNQLINAIIQTLAIIGFLIKINEEENN